MKKWAWMLPFYVGALLLQLFLCHLLPVTGAQMHLVLALSVVALFLCENSVAGLVLGVLFCLMQDLFVGMYTGPGAVSMVCVCALTMLLRQMFNRENTLNMLLLLLFTTWLYATVYWIVYAVLGSPYTYLYAMKRIPVQLAWNCGCGILLYVVWRRTIIRHRKDRYFQ